MCGASISWRASCMGELATFLPPPLAVTTSRHPSRMDARHCLDTTDRARMGWHKQTIMLAGLLAASNANDVRCAMFKHSSERTRDDHFHRVSACRQAVYQPQAAG